MPNTRSNPQWDNIVEVRGPAHLLDVSHHARFNGVPCGYAAAQSDREGTQEIEEYKMFLKFSTAPHNGTPWFWFGQSHGTNTDVLINSATAISRCHIQLGFDGWGQVVIRDVSKFGSLITYTSLAIIDGADTEPPPQSHEITGDKNDPSEWVVPVGWKVEVQFARTGDPIRLQVPDHSAHIQEYQDKVRKFKDEQSHPVPLLGGLDLNSRDITTGGSMPTVDRYPPGSSKGRYAWIIGDKKLGDGAYGEVFEVFNSANWAKCAGKRLQKDHDFQHEHSLMKQLDHPHIARYIDVQHRKDSLPMIIMEYCGLGSLDKQQKDLRFDQDQVIRIIAQAAAAIAYLHSQRVTHRDLKPANILVRSREPLNIAVSDFGVSKQGESVMSTFAGTYYYMAPEVVADRYDDDDEKLEIKYNNKSDIWSLGIVAVELINERLPRLGVNRIPGIYDQSYAKAMAKSRDGILASCGNKDFARLVKEMLSWDPEARPTASECFQRSSLLVAEGAKGGSRSVARPNKRQPSDTGTTTKRPAKKAMASPAPESFNSNPGVCTLNIQLERELGEDEAHRPGAAAGGDDPAPSGGEEEQITVRGDPTRAISIARNTNAEDAQQIVSEPSSGMWARLGTVPPTPSHS